MKPNSFDYLRAQSTQQALEMLADRKENARVLAGGQSLMAVLNMRLAQPPLLIDISRTADLNYMRLEQDRLIIGAAVTQGNVEWRSALFDEVPMLSLALRYISHFQIRNRGTVCGSVAHADPSAEIPLVLTALGGEVVLRSLHRRRVLPASQFFQGMLMTAKASDELVESVQFPLRKPGARYGFVEFSARHGDFALVACAATVTDHAIELAVGGVADRPTLEKWPLLEGAALKEAINDFSWKLGAQDDVHVSAQYRRHLVRELAWRAIEEAE